MPCRAQGIQKRRRFSGSTWCRTDIGKDTEMSAFFCNDSTIDKVVTAILRQTHEFESRDSARWDLAIVREYQIKKGTELGLKLRAMNADAMRQRYGDKFTAKELRYTFSGFRNE